MTNHWIDIGNSDCILIMGSNAAENHPISFKWVAKAMENGATLISVDPRFTRTSAKADIYTRLRSGTDIAFLGGMTKYILDNNLYNETYVRHYTNAPFLVNRDFRGPADLDGLFSGYNEKTRKYDKSTWKYRTDGNGVPERDMSMEDPYCVFQLLKKHFARYDLDTVSAVTGTPKEDLLKVYETYTATGKTGKSGTIMYAMGWTQHTVGTQNIRTMAINQLLLGNMGVCGGGVNALRGESNVQGSTDHCLLWHILPGYLKIPVETDEDLATYNTRCAPVSNDPRSLNWWKNYSKYSVSLLKSMYGDAATAKNDFGFGWLPKCDQGVNYSWISLFQAMYRGEIEGFFAWGMNPAVSSSNANMVRKALEKLDWMVNVNLWETETGAFWNREGADPSKIKTEVFLLPCAASMEKEGSITNSGRWGQWRYKACDPPGDAKGDGEMIIELTNRVQELYRKEGGAFEDPIVNLKLDGDRRGRYDAHAVAKEINGYFLEDVDFPDKKKKFKKGDLVPSFAYLRDDGSTSSGNWLYCASYTNAGNMMARTGTVDKSGVGLYSEWSWCWPVNRRIIYNRASVDLDGNPWDAKQPVIKWNGKGWDGDVPDGGAPPMNQGGYWPFIMIPNGFGRIFGPGRAEGPFPEHYEPLECPTKNLICKQQHNPTIFQWHKKGSNMDACAGVCDPRFPIVATTYRVSEHWQTGAMTRHIPWLAELQPEMFVEMSRVLAKEKGIDNGEWVTVVSARGKVKAKALVTARFQPVKVGGVTVHQVGLPWCYGYKGIATGDSANTLVPNIGDANTMIPESKAFLVDVRKGV
jgi:formate dehydrogenase major subunit